MLMMPSTLINELMDGAELKKEDLIIGDYDLLKLLSRRKAVK
jgi:hypothetical protein